MSSETNDRVFVNGAWIDSEFLDKNVREAKGASWAKIGLNPEEEHHHCIVCNFAISPQNSAFAYQSHVGWLCSYCFDHFIREPYTERDGQDG